MKNSSILVVSLLAFLFAVCTVHAYVYYVEAEKFDPDKSTLAAAGGVWSEKKDKAVFVFSDNYMEYTGPHAGANTSLIYPIPIIGDTSGQWKVWVRCLMPDGGSDSYFFYVSNDDGKTWGPQQTAHGSGQSPDWKWENWVLDTKLKKGSGNVLRIAERETARADVVCMRDDGQNCTDEDCAQWFKENKSGQPKIAVQPFRKLATTWGQLKKQTE